MKTVVGRDPFNCPFFLITENLVVRPEAPINLTGRFFRAIFPVWFYKSSRKPFHVVVRKSEILSLLLKASAADTN